MFVQNKASALSSIGNRLRSSYRRDPHNVIASGLELAVGGAIVVGAAFTIASLAMNFEAPDRSAQLSSKVLEMTQESHGAFAKGVADGLMLSGATIAPETLKLVDEITPAGDLHRNSNKDRLERDQHNQAMRHAGMTAAMIGEFNPEDLHRYAEFIRDMPGAVQDLASDLGDTIERLTQDPKAREVASLAVTVGLLIENGEIQEKGVLDVINVIGQRMGGDAGNEVSHIMMRGITDAMKLREIDVESSPHAEGISRMVGKLVARDIDQILTVEPETSGPEI